MIRNDLAVLPALLMLLCSPAEAAGWVYRADPDAMSGKMVKSAVLTSKNQHDLHWPYGPGVGAFLEVRHHPRSGSDIIVSIQKGQILCHSYQACRISVRFDNKPPQAISAVGSSDGDPTVVFLLPYARLAKEIAHATTMLVELPLYQDGDQAWEFGVAGLSADKLK